MASSTEVAKQVVRVIIVILVALVLLGVVFFTPVYWGFITGDWSWLFGVLAGIVTLFFLASICAWAFDD